MTEFSRIWAMPNADTFSIPPIRQLVRWHLERCTVSVDPFARNNRWATHTNDLNPNTEAEHHMDAAAFLIMLAEREVVADLLILDPPYSPRQMAECYSEAGMTPTTADTQNGRLMAEVRTWMEHIAAPDATALCFGWNSTGMGGDWKTDRVVLICHGGAHNDTICTVQHRERPDLFASK